MSEVILNPSIEEVTTLREERGISALFIGGPLDGKLYTIEPHIWRYVAYEGGGQPYAYWSPKAIEQNIIKLVYYERRSFKVDDKILTFFILQGLSCSDAMMRLVEGYQYAVETKTKGAY